jgi:hypothetical protein
MITGAMRAASIRSTSQTGLSFGRPPGLPDLPGEKALLAILSYWVPWLNSRRWL